MKIQFTNMSDFSKLEPPIPASEHIPEWYKKMESYVGGIKKPGGDGHTLATIKRCMPVFDALTGGYIIVSPADVFVSIDESGDQRFEWVNFGVISFHPITQAPTHPSFNGWAYPKWNNLWAIKTPKGYSTLFVQPLHRESPFTIMAGVVDTDVFYAPVNFPFVMNDPKFEGLIPAGTPIAQVLPFKRDNWQMEFTGQKEAIEAATLGVKLNTRFFDRYKNMFRVKKEYK